MARMHNLTIRHAYIAWFPPFNQFAAIMTSPNPTRASNIALQIPQDYFYSVASMSSSTTELSSPALSSRALYAETFERPDTARSLPTGTKRKDMEELLGQKREFITNENDFNALPASVRKKVRTTLYTLAFFPLLSLSFLFGRSGNFCNCFEFGSSIFA